jgi:hypothetical protein
MPGPKPGALPLGHTPVQCVFGRVFALREIYCNRLHYINTGHDLYALKRRTELMACHTPSGFSSGVKWEASAMRAADTSRTPEA